MLNAFGAALSAVTSFYALDTFMRKKQTKDSSTQSVPQNTFFKMDTVEPPIRKINYPHFNILYSTYHKTPLAVYQFITKQVAEGDAPRSKFFYPDDHIKEKHFQVDNTYFYQTKAYFMFNVNRGHMAAAGNYSGNIAEKFLTFSFANILPQDGTNNGGIWNTFERYSRNLAINGLCDSVEVISGPIFPKNTPYSSEQPSQTDGQNEKEQMFRSQLKVLKRNGIIIPQKLYKIIKCNAKSGTYIGVYENLNSRTQDNSKDLNHFEVKLDKVERQTGLKFNIQGKNLKQIDEVTLKKTKREIDYPFYFGLMQNSVSLSEMSGGLRRANSQKIQIQLQKLTEKIRQMLKKETQSIINRDISNCQKLKKLFSLNRKLTYLKHTSQFSEQRSSKINQYFTQCKGNQQEYAEVGKTYKQEISQLLKQTQKKDQ